MSFPYDTISTTSAFGLGIFMFPALKVKPTSPAPTNSSFIHPSSTTTTPQAKLHQLSYAILQRSKLSKLTIPKSGPYTGHFRDAGIKRNECLLELQRRMIKESRLREWKEKQMGGEGVEERIKEEEGKGEEEWDEIEKIIREMRGEMEGLEKDK